MSLEQTDKNTSSNNRARKKRRPKKISPTYLHNYALFYLERFSTSSANLRSVLMRRVYKSVTFHGDPSKEQAEEWVDDLVRRFGETGLVDDALYAKGRTRSLRRSGNSRRQIAAKLMQKGVPSSEIDGALEAIDSEEEGDAEMQAAHRYVQRRRLGRDPQRREKDLASLARAGFSYDIAKSALESNEKDKIV